MSLNAFRAGCSFRRLASLCGLGAALVVFLAVAVSWIATARDPSAQTETVEVFVAAKDLPVGTRLDKDDLEDEKLVKVKRVPKAELPSAYITNKDDLADKRLSRPLRTGAPFNPQDLIKGTLIT